jgi:hypothetical protein
MNGTSGERLYHLLPAVYRRRDVAEGEPLRALLSVLEDEFTRLEGDIARLYDNWFIETCDEWVVPYIGDLLGVRGLLPVQNGAFSQRALVANTLAYRRRKGTAAVLEQLARDITGWPAKAVEFFERLVATQTLNHVRPLNLSTTHLRDANQLELATGPFESTTHTVDVRHIDNARGRYNIPHVGVFLWRLQSYAMTRSSARAVSDPPDGRYTFSPLGYDAPLFNRPRTELTITQSAGEANVPGLLRRRPLYDELEAYRQALVDGAPTRLHYFADPPVLEVFVQRTVDTTFEQVPPEQILICHLGDPAGPSPVDWRRPPTGKLYRRAADGQEIARPIQVAVDPVLGRLAFPAGATPHRVEVSYAYGFSGDFGGGPYDRRRSLAESLTRPITWQIGVTATAPANALQLVQTLAEAVQAWNAQPPGTVGVIAVMDSRTYGETLTGTGAITVPEGSQLTIVAADWPEEDVPGSPGQTQRVVGRLTPSGRRPHLRGDLAVRGTAAADRLNPGELAIDGLLIEGALTVMAGNLGRLRLSHATLVPSSGGLSVEASTQAGEQNVRLTIALDRGIVGPLTVPDTVQRVQIVDSIVDGGQALVLTAPATDIQASTILGRSRLRSLEASNSIFTGTVQVSRRQLGCVRFCYLPIGSQAPRRFRCQPADAASAGRVVPQFTSLTYGQPGYAQLTPACPAAISAGADDEGEMGVFHTLQQTHRLKNLRASLEEYLRFGLEAGILFVT